MIKFIKGWCKVVVACTCAMPSYTVGIIQSVSTGDLDKCCEGLINNFDRWAKKIDPAVKELEDVHFR